MLHEFFKKPQFDDKKKIVIDAIKSNPSLTTLDLCQYTSDGEEAEELFQEVVNNLPKGSQLKEIISYPFTLDDLISGEKRVEMIRLLPKTARLNLNELKIKDKDEDKELIEELDKIEKSRIKIKNLDDSKLVFLNNYKNNYETLTLSLRINDEALQKINTEVQPNIIYVKKAQSQDPSSPLDFTSFQEHYTLCGRGSGCSFAR